MVNLTRIYLGVIRARAVLFQFLSALAVTGLLFACVAKSSGDGTQPAGVAGDLVSSGEIATLGVAQLDQTLAGFGITGISVSGSVTCYKLSYITPDVSNNLITGLGPGLCAPGQKRRQPCHQLSARHNISGYRSGQRGALQVY